MTHSTRSPGALRRKACTAALLGCAALLSASPAAWALTPGVDAPPLPGEPQPLAVPLFEEGRLPNGLRVIVAPRHKLPLVAVALHLGLGAAADPEGRAGLASLTAALRSKGAALVPGAKPLDATQIARQTETLGSTLDSMSDWRGSALTMSVSTPKVDAALALIAASTLRPTLAEDELQRLREQTADGLKLSLSDPMALAGLAAQRSYWGASVFGGSTTPASLARITRKDVLAFAQAQARPELATLVLAGDIDLPQALSLARHHLGDWVATGSAPLHARKEGAAPATPSTVLIQLAGAGQSGVVVMAPSLAKDSPERRVAQVASALLGGGYSSRLNQEIRIKRGLSYGAHTGLDLQAPGGRLIAGAQTKHPSAAEVATLMRREILQMGQTLATPEELAARQATLVGNFGRGIETCEGLTRLAIDLVAADRPLAEAQKFAPEVFAVTAVQVRDHAAKYWKAESLRTVVVGDLDAAGESLKGLDARALRLDAGQLDLESPGLTKQP